ncbi:hypothetical protein IG631_03061 [Alternaria alternata]|nr:hypothetical protein IG631_03061 [Alternaria alternata]
MEVKGEYGRASSTVRGGLLYGSPPPLPLCQLPFIALVVASLCVCRQAQWRCRRGGLDGSGHMAM